MPLSGTDGYEFLGSTVLTGSAATTGALTIAARDLLLVQVRVTGYSGGDIASFRFNGDSGTNYWWRCLNTVAGGVTWTNQQAASATLIQLHPLTTTLQRSSLHAITNLASKSKVMTTTATTSTGSAATVGGGELGWGEWVNTTAQITSIELRTAGGSITMPAGTGFAVFGRNL
jgi:hypothetical protein